MVSKQNLLDLIDKIKVLISDEANNIHLVYAVNPSICVEQDSMNLLFEVRFIGEDRRTIHIKPAFGSTVYEALLQSSCDLIVLRHSKTIYIAPLENISHASNIVSEDRIDYFINHILKWER